MFKKILILTLFIVSLSGQVLAKTQASKKNSEKIMEIFNKERFEKNMKDGEYNFKMPNGMVVRQVKFGTDTYVEYTKYPHSAKEILKEYDAHSLNLKTQGETFHGFKIGIWTEYGKHGEVTTKINADGPYQFSIDDLVKKMQEIGVDIMREEAHLQVSRSTNPSPVYNVSYPLSPKSHTVNVLIIDGRNGEILNKSQVTVEG